MSERGTVARVPHLPTCDMCKEHPAAYDARMRRSRAWAFLCEGCWTRYGIGRLGTGYGQRLIVRTADHDTEEVAP